jgi:type I restriction enzyme R subunit
MSPHAYTEDQLVEQPAIGLFAVLGWQTVSAKEEVFGANGTLGNLFPDKPGDP